MPAPNRIWRCLILTLAFSLMLAPDLRGDWPMLGCDVLRSGATTTEIRPPFERKWYRLFADEGLQSGVQPIVHQNRVYVGTMAGRLHAIHADSGVDQWVFQSGGAILHTCAAANGKVFFGSADGRLYAVDAATGKGAWVFETGAAIWNAPAVHQGRVYFGGRDGNLYAVDAGTGKEIWSASTGAPLHNSPAIDPNRDRVYVGSETMRVFAFDLHSGRRIWRSEQLPGVSMRGFHPTIAPDGSVMVTVTPAVSLGQFQTMLYQDLAREIFGLDHFQLWRYSKEEQEQVRRTVFEALEDPGTYERQLDYFRRRLGEEPAYQTFFVIDPENGRQRFVVPIIYSESMNGSGAPPVVTPDGRVIVKYQAMLRSRYGHYSPFVNVGYLDTATGHITPIMDSSRTYGWYDSLRMVHDEQAQLAVAGSLLLNTAQDIVSALDLKTLAGYPHPFCRNIHEPQQGEAIAIWQCLVRNEPLPVNKEWIARGTAVYGGGSVIGASVTVSGDSLYYIPTHEINSGVAVIAYRMAPDGDAHRKRPPVQVPWADHDWDQIEPMPWDWDLLQSARLRKFVHESLPAPVAGTRERPLTDRARTRAAAVTDSELDRVVWETRPPTPLDPKSEETARLRRKLAEAVQERISSEWRPLVFPAGTHPVESYRLFVDPSETLYALARAYPHLEPRLQGEVRAYVDRQRAPGKPLASPLTQAVYAPDVGQARALYSSPPEHLMRIRNDITRNPVARLYPLWLWAEVSDDWTAIESTWTEIRPLRSQPPNSFDEDCWNGHIAGLIAYCRIARHMKDEETVEAGLRTLRSMLRQRLEYEWAHPRGGVITFVPAGRSIFGRWRHLTPELGWFLGEHAGDIQGGLMRVYVDYHRPTWWLAWNVELMWRNESPFSFPTMSREIFDARAFILKEPATQLSAYLDLPWCRADEFHIQKLVVCLEDRRTTGR